ncbi:hypothetical protein D3C78_1895200 [compost metagenome]
MIERKDLVAPTMGEIEKRRKFHIELKQMLTEKFGPDQFMSLDFEAACEYYEPVNIEITQEQFEYAKELMDE